MPGCICACMATPARFYRRLDGSKGKTAAMAAQPTSPTISRSRIVLETPAARHVTLLASRQLDTMGARTHGFRSSSVAHHVGAHKVIIWGAGTLHAAPAECR